MKKLIICAVSAIVSIAVFASATIENVIVRQQWPWNGKVNIDYILRDASGGSHDINIECKDGNKTVTNAWGSLSGDLVGVKPGAHRIVWDPTVGATEGGKSVYADFTAALSVADEDDLYMVIDVSEGPTAEKFPISFVNTEPAGGWNKDEYKTSKIVLRRIPAGTYMMGSPEDELGRKESWEKLHKTTITRPFYVGVFEMTQKQYENITGSNPSNPDRIGETYPVNKVSYIDLRGEGAADTAAKPDDWPAYHAGGFFAAFNPKVNLPVSLDGYVFDLPSSAEWEFACRGGTTGAWNNGTTITNETTDANLTLLGWYRAQSNTYPLPVGGKEANSFGLYDMHGNVGELIIDFACLGQGSIFDGSDVVDPILYAAHRYSRPAARGGGVGYGASAARSASYALTVSTLVSQNTNVGFRLACCPR